MPDGHRYHPIGLRRGASDRRLPLVKKPIPPGKLALVLVDDDADVRRTVARFLRSCGHDVCAFESAEAFLAASCAADCAIFDIHLPGISGLALADQVTQEGRRLPVVFISAFDDTRTRARAAETRRPLLAKPFDDDGLLEAIEVALSGAMTPVT
jgi:FixJ family two-component response regulator